MASSPVTAPSSDSPPAPPSSDSSPPPSDSSPPPPSESSPPPSSDSSPPPPSDSSSPPPSDSSPPPPSSDSSSPPPSSSKASPPPPTKQTPTPPDSNYESPQAPPPPRSSSSSGELTHPPPPRASSHKSPPPPPSEESSSSGGLNDSQKAIIGGAVAVAFFIVLLVVCVVCAKRKKRRKNDSLQYYGPPKGGVSDHQYYNSSQHPNWHNGGQMGDHVVKLPPGASPHGGGWPAPPPPPIMMNSGEVSSNFSGPRHPPLPPPSPTAALGFNKSTFSYEELAAATGGFAQANLLGQGGFGYVHKGVLPNGKEVAVKSLKSGSGQGEREFQAEVEIISRVHHRHLVSLVGYCIAGGQRMLVYEFVPNNNLEHHLYGKGLPVMDWPTRLRIGLGSAKGLAYLHEDCHPRIIHRDIKTANILLDYNFEAMVADFGLAKLSSDNYTHVSTRVMGTFGYLAPEYAASGKLSEKSDVFSFGVMLLELITGKRPVDPNSVMEDSLVDWARPLLAQGLKDGNFDELVDPLLERNYATHEMARMVACAAASIRHSARKRPKMSQVVRALEGDVSLEDINAGTKPGQSSVFSSSSDYDADSYNSDMKKFRKMALSSQEFSSEYAMTSSDGNSREMGTPVNKASPL